MSKSLIRKNQLHPDVADLVSGYGDNFFITPQELADALLNFSPEIRLTGQNVVYVTGNQTISGIKNFASRPTFNGSGLATTGDLAVGTTVFNGDRVISAQVAGFQGVQPGGNDVVTFLNNVFYPFVQATVTLSNFGIQELGTTLNNINFGVTINPGSLSFGTDITNAVPYVGTNNPRNPTVSTPSSSFTITNVDVGGLTNNTSNVFVRINTKNQAGSVITLDSSPRTINFEAPMYAGSGVNNLQSPPNDMKAVLTAQTNSITNNGKAVIQEPSSRTVTVTTNGFYYFVYPDSWGQLSRIAATSPPLDFTISSDFVTGNVTLTLANGANHLYRFYKNTNQITLNNYGVVYHF